MAHFIWQILQMEGFVFNIVQSLRHHTKSKQINKTTCVKLKINVEHIVGKMRFFKVIFKHCGTQ